MFVTLCRKFDDKTDLDNEGDDEKQIKNYNGLFIKVISSQGVL